MVRLVIALACASLIACSEDTTGSPASGPDGGGPGNGGDGDVSGDGDAAGDGDATGDGDGVGDGDGDAVGDGDGDGPPPSDCVCDASVAVPAECDPVCDTAFEVIFAASQFAGVYLTIEDASWNTISSCAKDDAHSTMPPPECDYQPATFHMVYAADPDDPGSQLVTTPEIPVGVRRKGRVSWRDMDDKPSLKVKFVNISPDKFMGLSRLTLNNMYQDHSMLHERTAYRVYRLAGLPAPLANNMRVYVRRSANADYESWGVYANIQTLDKRFIHYAVPPGDLPIGNLYDTYNNHYYSDLDRSSQRDQAGTAPGAQESRFELETNEMANDTSDLTALLDAIYVDDPTGDNSQFMEEVGQIADVDQFMRLFATQALITDWDGFAGIRNNYKLYHDPVSDRFVMFPWGTDQSFAWWDGVYYVNWDYRLQHDDSVRTESLFMRRCVDDAGDCYARYLVHAQDVLDAWNSVDLAAEVQVWAAQTDQAMADDNMKFYSTDDSRRSRDYLIHYMQTRGQCFGGQLSGNTCANMDCPLGGGFFVRDCTEN